VKHAVRRGSGAAVLHRHRCAAKLDAKAASRGFLLLHKGKKKEGGRAELLLGHGDVVGEGAGLREKGWDSKGAEEVGSHRRNSSSLFAASRGQQREDEDPAATVAGRRPWRDASHGCTLRREGVGDPLTRAGGASMEKPLRAGKKHSLLPNPTEKGEVPWATASTDQRRPAPWLEQRVKGRWP
jgi:hypothetical protein